MVEFGKKWLFWGKVVVYGQKCFNAGNSGCIRATVVVLGQKWLLSGISGCIRANLVVFGQKWLYIRAKLVLFGQKRLYSGKVVVFGQSCCIREI